MLVLERMYHCSFSLKKKLAKHLFSTFLKHLVKVVSGIPLSVIRDILKEGTKNPTFRTSANIC